MIEVKCPKCGSTNVDEYAWSYNPSGLIIKDDTMGYQCKCVKCSCEFDVTCSITVTDVKINVKRDSETKS